VSPFIDGSVPQSSIFVLHKSPVNTVKEKKFTSKIFLSIVVIEIMIRFESKGKD
jgi:hypothetical protein